MVIYPCFECGHAIRILDMSVETEMTVGPKSERWPHGFNCPICDCQVSAIREMDLSGFLLHSLTLHDLTGLEAFLAFEGMGMPEERGAKFSDVQAALASGVVSVVGEDTPNTSRCSITSIECGDGRTLYLGASPLGAIVYRLRNKHSYVHRRVELEEKSK